MLSIRSARRYHWRLAGGRLIAGEGSLRFTPNRLERRFADASWQCRADDIVGVHVREKVWLVIEAAGHVETFRVFGAAAVVPRLEEAMHLGGDRKR